MTVNVHTGVVVGVEGQLVRMEANLRPGIPYFDLVGLAGSAVKEARTRVEQAVRSSAMEWPRKRITLNLAPAELKKEGSGLDLAMAIACLAEPQQLDREKLNQSVVLGELSLNGELRPVRGVLPIVECAKKEGLIYAIVPSQNNEESRLIDGIKTIPVTTLNAAINWLKDGTFPDAVPAPQKVCEPPVELQPDWSLLRGQNHAKRAAEIALSGGHNMLLSGPPGTGKTLLARCLPNLLPPLQGNALLEVLRVRSVTTGDVTSHQHQRPFRAPHHSISTAGLVGGGRPLCPGEITIAHGGVLFLDELAEFPRQALESLRQPLEEGQLTITRAGCRVTFPARVMVVAASNPCPCGFLGTQSKGCSCPPSAVARYRNRLSGPMMDRIDIHTTMDRPAAELILSRHRRDDETSAVVRQRIQSAQEKAFKRQGCLNAHLKKDPLDTVAAAPESIRMLTQASDRLNLSPRRITRLLKVARSIADLEAHDTLQPHHLAEALTLRSNTECTP